MTAEQLSYEQVIAELEERENVAKDVLVRCGLLLDTLGHSFDDKVGELRRLKVENFQLREIISTQEKSLEENKFQILDLARQLEELRRQLPVATNQIEPPINLHGRRKENKNKEQK